MTRGPEGWMASMLGAETTLDIGSPDAPASVAKVLQDAEPGCFFTPALLSRVPVVGRTIFNGLALAMG